MLVSFIVPAYKSEDTLKICLSSIISLSGIAGKYEIIVVLCRANRKEQLIIANFPEKLILIHTKARNRSLSRNLGVKVAKGKFLAFIDSDIKLDKDWFINSIGVFNNKLVAASQGDFLFEKNANKYIKKHTFAPKMHQCIISPFGPVIVTGACIYRKSIFDKVEGFDERITWNEDLDLSVRAFYSGYALAYQEESIAFLLEKKITKYGILKRNFNAGKSLYVLYREKYNKVFVFQILKKILVNNENDLVSRLGKACGFFYSSLKTKKLKVKAEFKSYRGFKSTFENSASYGLIYINSKRYILDINSRVILCIK